MPAPGRLLIPDVRELVDRAAFEQVYQPPDGVHVRVNFVTSVDGAVEVGGTSEPLGGAVDKHAFMAMRAVSDVILAGAGTVRAENYGPARLEAEVRERRIGRGQAPLPTIAVVTSSGGLATDARLFAEETDAPQPIVLTTDSAPVGQLEQVADVIRCGEDEVDVAEAIRALSERGFHSVLCEGGPNLTAHLMAAGVVDELCITIAPQLAGGGRRSLSAAWSGPPVPLQLESLIEGDGLLVARYRVAR